MPWFENATAMIFAYETGDRLAKKTAAKWHHAPPPLTNGKEKQYTTKHLSYGKKKTMNKMSEKNL